MTHKSTTILYIIGLYETMCFQITKENNYSVDKHGNRWRMFDGELEYYTGIQANSGFATWASVVGD